MPSAWGQDLTGLATRFEQLKLSQIQTQLARRPELGVFITATGLSGAQQVHLTLLHDAAPPRHLALSASSGADIARLLDLQPGRYQLEAQWTVSSGEKFQAQRSFELSSGWNEIELALESRTLRKDKLALTVWQRAPADPGSWQRVAAWVPGLIATELRYVRHPQDLPAMRWAQAQCHASNDFAAIWPALLELLHTLTQWPSDTLTAHGYASLSRCLLSAGLARTAVPILAEWAARFSRDERLQQQAQAAALALSRFAHWPELVKLGEQFEGHAVVRFYAALAALQLGQSHAAQRQLERLFFVRRAQDVARFARSDALTLQAGYNLALSYAAQGQAQKAMTLLDDIGRLPVEPGEAQHVVDMVNLKLGWMLLQHDQAASAKPVFRRMSLTGPFSRMALLGLGWSGLMPAGQPMRRMELEYPEVPAATVDTSALAVWVARWRAGEISCSALLAATERLDLCSPTTALLRDVGGALDALNLQQQVLAAWVELHDRPANDLLSIELLLGLSQLISALDRHEQSLALLQHTEVQLEGLAERLEGALKLAEAGHPTLWQQRLPAVQMWMRSAQGHGLTELTRQLDQFTRKVALDASDADIQDINQSLHQALYQGAQAKLHDTRTQLQRYELDLRVRLARQLDMHRNG